MIKATAKTTSNPSLRQDMDAVSFCTTHLCIVTVHTVIVSDWLEWIVLVFVEPCFYSAEFKKKQTENGDKSKVHWGSRCLARQNAGKKSCSGAGDDTGFEILIFRNCDFLKATGAWLEYPWEEIPVCSVRPDQSSSVRPICKWTDLSNTF